MKKNLFSIWVFLLAVFWAADTNAQATIGNKTGTPKAAEAFSALEIISNGTGGLRLPQLTTTQRTALAVSQNALANGLTIFNTTTNCVEYWNSSRWISLCEGTSQTTISPSACTNVAADGTGCDQTFDITDPDCPNGPFKITIIAGNEYASLTNVDEANGSYKVKFNQNESVSARSVVVRIVSTCTTQFKDFIYMQDGVTCTPLGTAPAVSPSSANLTLCAGGAVYLSVPAGSANLDKLIWTRNGIEVARGVNYYIATLKGTYNVSLGAAGCNVSASNERIITDGGTAPAVISTILASNSGILCGTSGTVKLTALGSPASVSWFHNGVLSSYTGSTITLSGSADQGTWFAAAGTAGCYSKPSNSINVTYQADSGSPIIINNADVLVNGTPINNVTTFCQGGSLNLEVNNKQPNITYTWYNGDLAITSPYTIPASQTSILLRMVATDNTGAACPAEASTTEKPISGGLAPAAPTISGSGVICGDSADLSVVPAVAGTYTYTWYEGSTKLPQTTQTISVKNTGTTYSATVTNASGCVSPPASKTTGSDVSDIPVLAWGAAPTPVNFGEQKVYETIIQYGPVTSYVWTVDGGATITGTGPKVSVKFPATGTAGSTINLKVKAVNACGTSAELPLAITVNNACTDPVVTAQSATSFTGGVVGAPITLKVSVTNGNTPSYQWYTGTAPSGSAISGANSATYIYTPTATGTVSLYCVVTNGCSATSKGTSPAFTVNTIINPADYPTTAALSITGKVCFDTKETFDNTVSGNTNGNATIRTETASPLPQGNQNYIVTATGKTISSVTWVADVTKFYSNTATSGTNNTTYIVTFTDLATIKAAVQDGYSASTANGQVITITAFVNFSDGTKGSISKVVKIQDFICCDGYICEGCAYDYSALATSGAPGTPNTAGDWARTGTPYNSQQSNLGIKLSYTTIESYFGSTSVGDLCVYKKDASYIIGKNAFDQAVIACQTGAGADGSQGVWYMPNIMEITQLFLRTGNTLGTPTFFGGSPGASALSNASYRSSTEKTAAFQYGQNTGGRVTFAKYTGLTNDYFSTRCVRRM
jgi:hypothetical protein